MTTETNPASETHATKTCPMCAETIKAAAIKCRFCGSSLSEAAAATGPTAPTPPPAPTSARALAPIQSPTVARSSGVSPAAWAFLVVGLGVAAIAAWKLGIFGSKPSTSSEERRTAARVECSAGTADSLSCTVINEQEREAKVCFRVSITCQNGRTATAATCQSAPPQGRAVRLLTSGEFQNWSTCDTPSSTRIDVTSAN